MFKQFVAQYISMLQILVMRDRRYLKKSIKKEDQNIST